MFFVVVIPYLYSQFCSLQNLVIIKMVTRKNFILSGVLSIVGLKLLGVTILHKKNNMNESAMKSVGLIGGTSWHSTIDYYKYINEGVNHIKGEKVNPPILIYNINQSKIHELQNKNDWESIAKIYVATSQKLIKAGVDAIAFCANTPHKIYDKVQAQIGVPIIHIADGTGEEANEKKLKTLGLIGTKFTMQEDFIKNRLHEKYGLTVFVPEETEINKLHQLIINELTKGKFTESAKKYTLNVLSDLSSKHKLDGIILGCTEFPMLIKQKDFNLPLLDTTQLHVKNIISYTLNSKKQ